MDDQLRAGLDEVVAHFGGGNRSEFLRRAVRDYQSRLRLERMHELRSRGRDERGGRTFSADEVLALIEDDRGATGAHPS